MASRTFKLAPQTLHVWPILLDCNFIVDSTNGNGLGIRSLKGPGIEAVYMNTSATPAAGNPNPAPGYIYVKLQDLYSRSYGGISGAVSPSTGAPISISGAGVLTVGVPYIIAAVGTSTKANWQAVGLPEGIEPAVGVPFIASVTGGGTGTGTVVASGVSGVTHIEGVGNSSLTVTAGYAIFKVVGPTDASTTTMIAKAPANGTVISLKFYLSNSSVTNQGE
jgi:hypothetical protein